MSNVNDFLVFFTKVMGTVLVVYAVTSQQQGPGLNSVESLWSLLVLPLSVWLLRFHPVIKIFTGLISCNYHQTLLCSVCILRRGR